MLATTKCILRSSIKPDFDTLAHNCILQSCAGLNIDTYSTCPIRSQHMKQTMSVTKVFGTFTIFARNYGPTNLSWSEQRGSRSASTNRANSEPASPGCEDELHQALWMACSWSASGTHPKPPKMTFYDIAVGSATRSESAAAQQQQPEEGSHKLQ